MAPPEARFVTASGILVLRSGAAALEEVMQDRGGLVEAGMLDRY